MRRTRRASPWSTGTCPGSTAPSSAAWCVTSTWAALRTSCCWPPDPATPTSRRVSRPEPTTASARRPAAAEIRERVDAGRRFVEVPWERAARGAPLEAVRARDLDDDDWDRLESRDERAGRSALERDTAELEAMLKER